MDCFRDSFVLKHKCAKCGDDLSLSSDKSESTAHSGYEVTGVLSVYPCSTCIGQADAFKRRLREFMGMGNDNE